MLKRTGGTEQYAAPAFRTTTRRTHLAVLLADAETPVVLTEVTERMVMAVATVVTAIRFQFGPRRGRSAAGTPCRSRTAPC